MSHSPASSTETIVVSETKSLLNVNMTNVTKLTASNFLMWSRQVSALLDGYDLAGYLDGSVIIPPETITTDGVLTANPAYTIWKRQDKLVYSALLGAITVSIQPILSTTTTSAQIWEILSATYAKPREDTSNNSGSRSNIGRKVPKPLMSMYKVLLPDLIKFLYWESLTIWRIKLNISWRA